MGDVIDKLADLRKIKHTRAFGKASTKKLGGSVPTKNPEKSSLEMFLDHEKRGTDKRNEGPSFQPRVKRQLIATE